MGIDVSKMSFEILETTLRMTHINVKVLKRLNRAFITTAYT